MVQGKDPTHRDMLWRRAGQWPAKLPAVLEFLAECVGSAQQLRPALVSEHLYDEERGERPLPGRPWPGPRSRQLIGDDAELP